MAKIILCGHEIEVDDEDVDKIKEYSWRESNGYIGTTISLQTLLLGAKKDLHIDHKDRNPWNFKKENLRYATFDQNMQNRGKPRGKRKYSSIYKGVSFKKADRLWEAHICRNGVQIRIGKFSNEKAAALAYNLAAKKYHGEFAYLNKIDD